MKVVQIGILVALVVVAGLLLAVYQQQKATPSPPAAMAPAAAPAPQVVPAEASAPAPEKQDKFAASEENRPQVKPSPAPARRKAERTAPRQAPVRIAQTPKSTAAGIPVSESQSPAAQSPVAQSPAVPVVPPPPAEEPAAAARPAESGLNPPSGTQTSPRQPHHATIAAGTTITVRLNETLSSDRNQPGDNFTATLDQPLIVDGFVLAERGARVEGRVMEAEKAGRVRGLSSLAIHLVRLHTTDGQTVDIETERFAKQGESSKADDAKKIGAGAAIGAAIGAIAGGGRGAAIGAGVGGAAGGGTVAATRGKAAVLPSETRITFRLQQAVSITEKIK